MEPTLEVVVKVLTSTAISSSIAYPMITQMYYSGAKRRFEEARKELLNEGLSTSEIMEEIGAPPTRKQYLIEPLRYAFLRITRRPYEPKYR